MGYKRAARVAFFSSDGELANAAVQVAECVGGGWIVASAVACAGLETRVARGRSSTEGGQAAWRQQDLLVTLDEPARALLARLEPPVPARHYGVGDLAPADQARAVEQRVKSMVAGMRMLARNSC